VVKALAITHGGNAHKDDFLTACLLLAEVENLTIKRREPTASELDDPLVWVFDIGGRHEPLARNFDHHQFPVDIENPRCALSLYLDYRGIYQQAKTAWMWLAGVEIIDCHGVGALAKAVDADPKKFFITSSPIDGFLISEFAHRTSISLAGPRDWLPEMMAELGATLLRQITSYHERLDFLREHGDLRFVNGCGVLIVPNSPRTRANGALASAAWQAEVCPNAGVIIMPDNRSRGWSLVRIDDDPRVDFRRVVNDPNVVFVPNSGWVAKLNTYDLDRALSLCAMAISPA